MKITLDADAFCKYLFWAEHEATICHMANLKGVWLQIDDNRLVKLSPREGHSFQEMRDYAKQFSGGLMQFDIDLDTWMRE